MRSRDFYYMSDAPSHQAPLRDPRNNRLLCMPRIVSAHAPSVSLGNVPAGDNATFPQPTDPDPPVVYVQATPYSSLVVSPLAGFVTMR